MSSGFFGDENLRDMKITALILAVIFISLFIAFACYQFFHSLVFAIATVPLIAFCCSFGLFGPRDFRLVCWLILAFTSLVACIIAGLIRVETATYFSIFDSIWTFIKGLFCFALVVLLVVGVVLAFFDKSSSATTSNDTHRKSDEQNVLDWNDDDEFDDTVFKYDEDSVEELIDALNEDAIDPGEIDTIIDCGAKNARISFRYKKPYERARRRKVIVKKVDGECLGCLELPDREYKSFRFDRISDVRPA